MTAPAKYRLRWRNDRNRERVPAVIAVLVDVLYAYIDPRIEYRRQRKEAFFL